MAKTIKMLLYGEPGIGKSTFCLGFPKPFYICSDGNYEWLEGADPSAHVEVSSWAKMKQIIDTNKFDGYDTIVVDLIEDFFKWCEAEYVKKKGLDHISDEGFGKGYDTTRTEFFVYMTKLISKPKNVIFISHQTVGSYKDKRGVEHTTYDPSSMLPAKVLEMLGGRLRYALHCYLTDEKMPDGTIRQHRTLALTKKPDEYNIIRGYDVDAMPAEIPLDAMTFLKAVGYFDEIEAPTPTKLVADAPTLEKIAKKAEPIKEEPAKEAAEIKKVFEEQKKEEAPAEVESYPSDATVEEEPKEEAPSQTTPKSNDAIRLEILKKLGKI